MKEFIFAYGSLLNKTSRERTFHTASIYKANIKKNSGYYRTFNFRSNTGFTALGLAKSSDESKCIGATINGIIIEVENVHDFQKLDDREVGYNRIDITEKDIEDFIDSFDTSQLDEIMKFFETMPKLRHIVKVKNPKTKVESEVTVEGLQSFLG